MKKIILSALIGLFGLSVSAQTVVRSLDDSSQTSGVISTPKPQASSANNNTTTAKPQPKDSKIATNTTTQLRHSYGGLGAGYSYMFAVVDGKTSTDNGLSCFRIPVYYNYIFGEHKSGIYGAIGYQYGKSEFKVNSTQYKTMSHYIPMQLHYSWNLMFTPTSRGQEHGLLFHAGPGLNIQAGGKTMYYQYDRYKGSKWIEQGKVDSYCDFTLGFGIGYRIDMLLFHFGFNGAVTTPKGFDNMHNCDFDISAMFAF